MFEKSPDFAHLISSNICIYIFIYLFNTNSIPGLVFFIQSHTHRLDLWCFSKKLKFKYSNIWTEKFLEDLKKTHHMYVFLVDENSKVEIKHLNIFIMFSVTWRKAHIKGILKEKKERNLRLSFQKTTIWTIFFSLANTFQWE